MSEIDRSPATLSISLSILAGFVSVAATAFGALTAVAPAFVGLLTLAGGLVRGSRRVVTAGGVLLFGGVVFAGASGSRPEPLLLGMLGAVVAWDVGENAINVGRQLGREAETTRLEAVHAATSLFVGAVAAGLGYGFFLAAAGGRPVTAVVFLLVGVVALVSALQR